MTMYGSKIFCLVKPSHMIMEPWLHANELAPDAWQSLPRHAYEKNHLFHKMMHSKKAQDHRSLPHTCNPQIYKCESMLKYISKSRSCTHKLSHTANREKTRRNYIKTTYIHMYANIHTFEILKQQAHTRTHIHMYGETHTKMFTQEQNHKSHNTCMHTYIHMYEHARIQICAYQQTIKQNSIISQL